MRVEVGARQYSIRVYEDDEATDYCASCQVFVYGDRGEVYSINGRRFYDALPLIFEQFHGIGIKRVEGYVSPAHARLMRMKVRNTWWTVEEGEEGDIDGHRLVWVTVREQPHKRPEWLEGPLPD